MAIIDYTAFTLKLGLPQATNTEGRQEIEGYIEQYEPEYLRNALGYDLWKAFSEGIEGSGEPDQRWVDLLEGKEFTHCGKTYKWEGFETTPIQNFVYCNIREARASSTMAVSEVVPSSDNSIPVSPLQKMVDAWNRMVDVNNILYMFLQENKDTYPEWDSDQKCNRVYQKTNQLGL